MTRFVVNMNKSTTLSAITYLDPASIHLADAELGNHQMISQLVILMSIHLRDGVTVAAAGFTRPVSNRPQ